MSALALSATHAICMTNGRSLLRIIKCLESLKRAEVEGTPAQKPLILRPPDIHFLSTPQHVRLRSGQLYLWAQYETVFELSSPLPYPDWSYETCFESKESFPAPKAYFETQR